MDEKPTVVFRCDADAGIGAGHVYRCMALAGRMASAGWSIGFAVSSATPATVPALAGAGWRVRDGFDVREDEPRRLAASWPEGVQLAVVDHYGRSSDDERRLRPWAERLLVIDDLADRSHDCELLLDPTFRRAAGDYAALLPPDARVLAGSGYALLRPEFAARRDEALRRHALRRPAESLLVSFGGTDASGLTLACVRALLAAEAKLGLDVVLGPASRGLDALQGLAARRSDLRVHVDTPHMAERMLDADLALGAAGSSSWERCCLGLPTVMLVLAGNQRTVAARLEEAGAAVAVGDGPDLEDRAAAAVLALAQDTEARLLMSRRASAVTDGLGASRALGAIETLRCG